MKTSRKPTQWAVHCPNHGKVYLTWEEYGKQLDNPEDLWHCPICWHVAQWDDRNYTREYHD